MRLTPMTRHIRRSGKVVGGHIDPTGDPFREALYKLPAYK